MARTEHFSLVGGEFRAKAYWRTNVGLQFSEGDYAYVQMKSDGINQIFQVRRSGPRIQRLLADEIRRYVPSSSKPSEEVENRDETLSIVPFKGGHAEKATGKNSKAQTKASAVLKGGIRKQHHQHQSATKACTKSNQGKIANFFQQVSSKQTPQKSR